MAVKLTWWGVSFESGCMAGAFDDGGEMLEWLIQVDWNNNPTGDHWCSFPQTLYPAEKDLPSHRTEIPIWP